MMAVKLAAAVLVWLAALLGILLAVLVGVLLLALLLPFCVKIQYEAGQLRLWAGAFSLLVPVYPRPPKKRAAKLKKRAEPGRKAAAAPAKAKPAEQTPTEQKTTAQQPAEQKLRLTAEAVFALAEDAGRLMRAVLRALRVEQVRLYVPVTGKDAAATALCYGQALAWLNGGLAALHNVLEIEVEEWRVQPFFEPPEEPSQEGSLRFSCKISARFAIIAIMAVRLAFTLVKYKVI